jgi:hypothetical protein
MEKEKLMKVVRDPKAQVALSLTVASLSMAIPQISSSHCPEGDQNDCDRISGSDEAHCVVAIDFWDDCI